MTLLQAEIKLIDVSGSHRKDCEGTLKVRKVTKRSHVSSLKLVCTRGNKGKHSYMWVLSPYLPNGKCIVNEGIIYAFLCGGVLPSHYSGFCNSAGFDFCL